MRKPVLKGFDVFTRKVPALKGARVALIPFFALATATLAFFFMLLFDRLPGLLSAPPPAAAFLPLAGVFVTEIAGLALVWQMWFRRDRLKKKYGERSYRRIFPVGFAGVSLLLAVPVHQFVPLRAQAAAFWSASPLAFLAAPPESALGPAGAAVAVAVKTVLAAAIGLTGVLLFLRALVAFGIDYMTVVYLYFPEESKIRKNEIYSALRHPAYAGAIYLALAGTIFSGTILSLAAFAVYAIGFWMHVRFVEERELVDRFGASYRTYRDSVPAFFPRKPGVLYRFLLGSKNRPGGR